MGATVAMVEDTGTGVTTTLEPFTTTMLVPTLTLLLRTTGCCWQAHVLWVAFGAGMWAGRWRSSWCCSPGGETGGVARCSPLVRTPGGREPSRMTTGDCSSICSAYPGTDSHVATMKYLKCQSGDTLDSWKRLRLIFTSNNPKAKSFALVQARKWGYY